ncbi:MAG: hypothetical protein IJK05_03805 [Bacteroidales bacterium]|nr:hypothetical protein [Bacteroidales bacterium]
MTLNIKHKKKDDFRNDEVQMLGTVDPFRSMERKRLLRNVALGVLVIVVLAGLGYILLKPSAKDDVDGLFETINEHQAAIVPESDSFEGVFTERVDSVVNGHPLVLFIPHGATPRLIVGKPDDSVRYRAVLALQAADIRADNKEILGEFVLDGVQLSRGVSKKGYCAIIDGEISVGVSVSTPSLSSALSGKGYFFRQYPLVDNGVPVDNKPKGKAVRKALCERQGQILVAVSANDETFGDFARTLVSLGVDNAIYLVGGPDAKGWFVAADGTREDFGADTPRQEYENESYLIWE